MRCALPTREQEQPAWGPRQHPGVSDPTGIRAMCITRHGLGGGGVWGEGPEWRQSGLPSAPAGGTEAPPRLCLWKLPGPAPPVCHQAVEGDEGLLSRGAARGSCPESCLA